MTVFIIIVLWLVIMISHYILLEHENKSGIIAFIPFYGDAVFLKVLVPQARWWFIFLYVFCKPFTIYMFIKSILVLCVGAIQSLVSFFSFMLSSFTTTHSVLTSNGLTYLRHSGTLFVLCIILCIFIIYAQSQFAKRIAKHYRKGSLFKLGLTFVPDLFLCVLAFSNSKPKRRGD